MNDEDYMRRCYELAISAGKKGHDSFGAVLVYNGKILEEAENTADFEKHIFGHAEFNLVHKCANKYTDDILEKAGKMNSKGRYFVLIPHHYQESEHD